MMRILHSQMTRFPTINDMVIAMSDGNPGAITVLMDSILSSKEIDPDNWVGELGMIMNLEMCEVYGSRIWMLFKDVCGERLGRTAAMLRAVQLGIISRVQLDDAIDGKTQLDVDEICQKVSFELPSFKMD